jgi:hypothetical protein
MEMERGTNPPAKRLDRVAQGISMREQWLETATRLRGTIPSRGPGACGLERMARNPACRRLRALTMVGTTPAEAMRSVYGEDPREGQSPFAIARGNAFEAGLFAHGAARLLALYREHGRLAVDDGMVVNIPDRAPGASPAAMARRRSLTLDCLERKLAGDRTAPHLLVKPRLLVLLLGAEYDIEPDALLAAGPDPFYRPQEIKSYPDRDGKTDPADLRGALRQAAVAVVALRQALHRLGISNADALVPARADLVLRRPGSDRPTLRPMTLAGEVDSLQRALDDAPRSLEELDTFVSAIAPGAALDDARVLDAIPNHYLPSCREHCALAPRCKRQAIEASDPVLLGTDAKEALAPISIVRAAELLRARDPTPRTPHEWAVAERLRDEAREYRRALRAGA